MLDGSATAEGTAHYRDRFPRLREAGHFRTVSASPGLWLSSIGLGTYLGEPDDGADLEYRQAIVAAVSSGINVLDTAINYRHQRSERNIGAALAQLTSSHALEREEVFVCTKAGYLPFDGNMPADPGAYFMREYVEPGILDPAQLAGGMHCMAPRYLENQIERSRNNLGFETLDLFYLHNPESQLADIPREKFYDRLEQAFALLETQVKSGRLRFYGMATWNGFRVSETARDYLDLFAITGIAGRVGGKHHHFRFLQLPFNLAMPEACGLANQGPGREKMSLFDAAAQLGISVMGSATLYQGRLAYGLPDALRTALGMKTDAGSAIQFARSAPGLTTALIGMGHKEHVAENLRPALIPPTGKEQWHRLFSGSEP
ncbi:MAG TPA: aldo/keto reductase [Terriglobales bacterium]|nr:aldo/keto reductase [Terriglobales bacterium]